MLSSRTHPLALSGLLGAGLLLATLACQPPTPTAERCDAGSSSTDAGRDPGPIRVAVYDGSGIWAPGLQAVLAALDPEDFEVQVVTADDVRTGELASHQAVVLAGGWAWDQWQGLGEAGITALRAFVLGGGGYLGICAGAYLASDDVVWEGEWIAYPLNLFDGIAEGPPVGLPVWPEADVLPIARVAGEHPLQGTGELAVYYQGGGLFLPRDPGSVQALLRYADGSLAALATNAGAGRAVLSGVHLEMSEGPENAALTPSSADNLPLLRQIVTWIAAEELP